MKEHVMMNNASSLQQELKKKDPFDSPAQEAVLNILRTSDLFQNQLGRLLRPFGLTPSQYNVLRILRGEGKAMSCFEIADRMVQVVPAMTGLLDRLEKQQFVSRERSSEDRRVVQVTISAKALDLLREIDTPLFELHERSCQHLTSAELAELIRLLEKARNGSSQEVQTS